jgi:hypothetical protein
MGGVGGGSFDGARMGSVGGGHFNGGHFNGGHVAGYGRSHYADGRGHYGYGRRHFVGGGWYDYGYACPYYTSYNWPYSCTY